nr:reverse transcriptase domain-containing protein [Tanacetum cinerariifolium]
MRTRSSSNLIVESFTIPKRRNRRRSKQIVEPELQTIVETPIATMAKTCTMSELLQAPTEGYGDGIVIPAILVENFELKVGLLSLKFDETFSEAWDRFKDLLRKCPHHGFLKLHQIDTFYNALKQSDQDSLNAFAGGNLLNRTPRDALTFIENKLKELVLMNKANQQASVKATEDTCVTCSGPHPYYECLGTGGNTFDACAAVGPYNQGTNPRGDVKSITTRSGVSYDGPSIPPNSSSLPKEVEREPEVTKDKVQTTKLLSGPPKKLPKKLRDPERFLIPCDFQGLESCMAPADLGASINLMPLSVCKKLSLPDLTPTRMTLELATRSIAYPAGIADDVFVQVGKFTFLADFIVIYYGVDPRVPLILGRPFSRTAQSLVDVHGEELILRDGDEKLIFHADSTLKDSHKHGNESINMINFIDITCKDHFPEVLKFKKSNHPSSGSTTHLFDFSPSLTPFETSDSLLKEFANELALLDPFRLGNEDDNFDFEVDLRKIEYLLYQDPSTESDVEIIDPILEKFTDEPAITSTKR